VAASLSITTSGIGATVLGSSSALHLDLFSGAGQGSNAGISSAADKLAIGGNFTIMSGADLFIDNPSSMSAWAANDSWQVFDLSNLGTLTGSFSTADIFLPTLASGLAWDTTSLLTTGKLSVDAVASAPEAGPGLPLLLLCGGFTVLYRRRRHGTHAVA
jgi:hypothetical protein